jgi:hypothetical protein
MMLSILGISSKYTPFVACDECSEASFVSEKTMQTRLVPSQTRRGRSIIGIKSKTLRYFNQFNLIYLLFQEKGNNIRATIQTKFSPEIGIPRNVEDHARRITPDLVILGQLLQH